MKRRMEEAEAQVANLRAKMEEILQCPVCLTVPGGSVVLQCHNGHIMCQGCANRTNACPMCRINIGQTQRYVKGPFIKDVRTKGGGGVSPKADIVREVAWIYSYRSSQNVDKGGGGPKS